MARPLWAGHPHVCTNVICSFVKQHTKERAHEMRVRVEFDLTPSNAEDVPSEMKDEVLDWFRDELGDLVNGYTWEMTEIENPNYDGSVEEEEDGVETEQESEYLDNITFRVDVWGSIDEVK